MSSQAPHFLLFSDADQAPDRPDEGSGRWRFVLQSVEDNSRLEAQDNEEDMSAERLELLAVVRGLEALDQPSRVTLVTPSRYVSRGLRYGLEEWRANRWRWERYGRMVPIKNNDLWKRVDRALEYHDVECRIWRFDSAHEPDGRTGRRHVVRPRSEENGPADSKSAKFRHEEADKSATWLGRLFTGRPR